MSDHDRSQELVDALGAVHGRHPGFRAVHARGTGAQGSFTASAESAALSRAGQFSGTPVPVVARFSNGSGNPDLPDGARDGRGLAVKFRLADGTSSDLVGLSLPVFFVRSVADFLAFLAARRPDPDTGVADPALVGAWVGEHPEALASGSTPSTWSMGP